MGLGVTILLVPPDAHALGSRSEFARAVLSRSIPSSLSRGLPLVSTLVLAPLRPSHGVSYLSATFDSGSDLHRGYLPRLCCALRLSQPLDAFFRPNLSTLFHADATQVSIFRGFPPAIASHASRRALSLLLFSDTASQRRRCNSRDCCTHGVRTSQTGVTRTMAVDPLLMFTPSRSSSLDLGPLAGASSHGLQHAAGPGPKPPPVVVLALQSFKEPRSTRALSSPSPSVGFSVQTPR
jgi:hypothetical protein